MPINIVIGGIQLKVRKLYTWLIILFAFLIPQTLEVSVPLVRLYADEKTENKEDKSKDKDNPFIVEESANLKNDEMFKPELRSSTKMLEESINYDINMQYLLTYSLLKNNFGKPEGFSNVIRGKDNGKTLQDSGNTGFKLYGMEAALNNLSEDSNKTEAGQTKGVNENTLKDLEGNETQASEEVVKKAKDIAKKLKSPVALAYAQSHYIGWSDKATSGWFNDNFNYDGKKQFNGVRKNSREFGYFSVGELQKNYKMESSFPNLNKEIKNSAKGLEPIMETYISSQLIKIGKEENGEKLFNSLLNGIENSNSGTRQKIDEKYTNDKFGTSVKENNEHFARTTSNVLGVYYSGYDKSGKDNKEVLHFDDGLANIISRKDSGGKKQNTKDRINFKGSKKDVQKELNELNDALSKESEESQKKADEIGLKLDAWVPSTPKTNFNNDHSLEDYEKFVANKGIWGAIKNWFPKNGGLKLTQDNQTLKNMDSNQNAWTRTEQIFFNGKSPDPLYTDNFGTEMLMKMSGTDGDKNLVTNSKGFYGIKAEDGSWFTEGKSKKSDISSNAKAITVNGFDSIDKKDDGHAIGMDAYGNLVNGFTGSLLLPYWQTPTISNKVIYNTPLKGFNDETKKAFDGITKGKGVREGEFKEDSLKDLKVDDGIKKRAKEIATELKSGKGQSVDDFEKKYLKDDDSIKAVAALVTGVSKEDVKKWNEHFQGGAGGKFIDLSDGGMTDKKDEEEKKANPNVYTQEDIIQRMGLITDFGAYRIDKSTSIAKSNDIYKRNFLRSDENNFSYTKRASDDANFNSFLPLLGKIIFILSFAIVLYFGFQSFRHGMSSWKQMFKVMVTLLVAGLLFTKYGAITDAMLNQPAQRISTKTLQRQTVMDLYQEANAERTQTNPMYAGLFGGTNFDAMNKTNMYGIDFYTTSKVDGSKKLPTAEEELKNKPKGKHYAGNGTMNWTDSPDSLVKVTVSSVDLINWAREQYQSTMAKDENGKFVESEESRNGKPKESLFEWLDHNYKSPKEMMGDKDKKEDQKEGMEDGLTPTKEGEDGEEASDDEKKTSDSSSNSSDSDSDSDDTGTLNTEDENFKATDIDPEINKNDNAVDNNDNAKAYKGVSDYVEYSVFTDVINSEQQKRLGLQDKKGTTIKASELFYALWSQMGESQTETGSEQPDGGSVDTFGALQNVSKVFNNDNISGEENKIDDKTISKSVKKQLIADLSMTASQRTILYGTNRLSETSQQLADKFNIKVPKSDYLGLDDAHTGGERGKSLVDLLKPDHQGARYGRDGEIYQINKKLLNNYIFNYSVARESMGSDVGNMTSATSEDVEQQKDQQEFNNGHADEFAVSEVRAMILDEFFVTNSVLKLQLFPTYYKPQTIPFDTWNKMVTIPMGELNPATIKKSSEKQLNTTTMGNKGGMTGVDNSAQYLSIKYGAFTVYAFLFLNILTRIFGIVYTVIFTWLWMPFILFQFIRNNFFKRNGQQKNLIMLFGGFYVTASLAFIKMSVIFIWNFLASMMNKEYLNNNGENIFFSPNLNIFVLIIVLIIALVFISKVIKTVLKSPSTLGGRSFMDGINNSIRNAKLKFQGSKNGVKGMFKRGGSGAGKAFTSTFKATGKQFKNGDKRLKDAAKPSKRDKDITREMKEKENINQKSKGNWFHRVAGKAFRKTGLNSYLSKYGAVDQTEDGISKELLRKSLKGDNISSTNLDQVSNIATDSAVEARLLSDMLNKAGYVSKVKGDDVLMSTPGLDISNPSVRKEVFDKVIRQASKEVEDSVDYGERKRLGRTKPLNYNQNGDGTFSIPVGNSGLSNKSLDSLIKSDNFQEMFNITKTPKTSNGVFANGNLEVIPKKGVDVNKAMQSLFAEDDLKRGRNIRTNSNLNAAMIVSNPNQNVGDDIRGLMVDGMRIQDGNLLYDVKDKSQVDAAKAIRERLASKVGGDKKAYSKIAKGLSANVMEGLDSGFMTNKLNGKDLENALYDMNLNSNGDAKKLIFNAGDANAKRVSEVAKGLGDLQKINPSEWNKYSNMRKEISNDANSLLSQGNHTEAENFINNIGNNLSKNDLQANRKLAREIKEAKSFANKFNDSRLNISKDTFNKDMEEYKNKINNIIEKDNLKDIIDRKVINDSKNSKAQKILNDFENQRSSMLKSKNINENILNGLSNKDIDEMRSAFSNIEESGVSNNNTISFKVKDGSKEKQINEQLRRLLDKNS